MPLEPRQETLVLTSAFKQMVRQAIEDAKHELANPAGPTRTNPKTYRGRNKVVKELGFKNYAAYQRSDLWESIKEKVIQYHGRQCKICHEPPWAFHHLNYTYVALAGNDMEAIVPLCKSCHYRVEFDSVQVNGKWIGHKRSIPEMWVRYRELKAEADNKREEERLKVESTPAKPVPSYWQSRIKRCAVCNVTDRQEGVTLSFYYLPTIRRRDRTTQRLLCEACKGVALSVEGSLQFPGRQPYEVFGVVKAAVIERRGLLGR